ncbi:MAG: zinc ribbon domain-containing protein [bacterium]|nr:zinc ribbon domain-containing protein [bacterium]
MSKRFIFILPVLAAICVLVTGPVLAFFCPNCGDGFTAGEKFCSNCGLPLHDLQEFIKTYRQHTQQRSSTIVFQNNQPEAENPITPAKPVEAVPEQIPIVPVDKTQAETVVIEPQRQPVRPVKPVVEPAPATGAMEIMLLFQGSDPEKYSKSGRVYINDKLIGSIYMISAAEMAEKGGYSTKLFGYATGLSSKRYYRSNTTKIPEGTYQVKVILKKKGFLRSSNRQKVWKTVTIKAKKEEKLFYSWGDSQEFGQ